MLQENHEWVNTHQRLYTLSPNNSPIYMATKSADKWAKKWKERAGVAEEDYKDGIQSSEDWQSATLQGSQNYEAGIKEALAEKRFDKGVQNTSTEEWRNKAIKKSGRFSSGVADAEGEYMQVAQQLKTHIDSGLPGLPKRGPRGSTANEQRAVAMMRHMRKFKK
jgi:hypothetical protein